MLKKVILFSIIVISLHSQYLGIKLGYGGKFFPFSAGVFSNVYLSKIFSTELGINYTILKNTTKTDIITFEDKGYLLEPYIGMFISSRGEKIPVILSGGIKTSYLLYSNITIKSSVNKKLLELPSQYTKERNIIKYNQMPVNIVVSLKIGRKVKRLFYSIEYNFNVIPYSYSYFVKWLHDNAAYYFYNNQNILLVNIIKVNLCYNILL